jgi:hypothetical protein
VRELADTDRIRRFMRALGREATTDGEAYFTGGATAVLCGWRATTIDVDVTFVPEDDAVLRALPRLKNELSINVELVSPADFIPVPPGWQDRSPFVAREGRLTFRHFDPYAQALAKLERAHTQDLEDVRALIGSELVDPKSLLRRLAEIEPNLYRYPAVDPTSFRRRVEAAAAAP